MLINWEIHIDHNLSPHPEGNRVEVKIERAGKIEKPGKNMKLKKIIGWALLIGGLAGTGYFGWPILQHVMHGTTENSRSLGVSAGAIISPIVALIGFILICKK